VVEELPYAADAIVGAFTGMYESYAFSDAHRAMIDRCSATALFPLLRSK